MVRETQSQENRAVRHVSFAVILPSAGRGQRASSHGLQPKQYRPLCGESSLARVIRCFLQHPGTQSIVVGIDPADRMLFQKSVGSLIDHLIVIDGGASRQETVRNALEALAPHPPAIVLIHDAARPYLSQQLISRISAEAEISGAAIPAIPMADTIIEASSDNSRGKTLNRDMLRSVQTPQGFHYPAIMAAHREAAKQGCSDFTDDGALMVWYGKKVSLVEGEPGNTKLTTVEDMRFAERHFAMANGDVRTGSGFDVHVFIPGNQVILGGIAIPHERGLGGHSDADVVLHALTDAILGALGDGDIGSHFPPSDSKWKGADSSIFLKHAVAAVADKGGLIAHLDATVICEAPKIGPHREAMRQRIADITGLAIDRISVKATTTESLGFTGRKEGIAAMATATVRLPWSISSMTST